MQHLTNILYVVERDAGPACGLERAVALARANQARLTVTEVIEPLPPGTRLEGLELTTDALQEAHRSERAQRLQQWVAPHQDALQIDVQVLTGRPFLELIRDVLRHGRDLVIKCVSGQPQRGSLFGSTDLHLLRKCPCPVWLSRPDAALNFERVLAAVDVTPVTERKEQQQQQALNARILDLAAALAVSEFAELHVAHAWQALGEPLLRGGLIATPTETKIDAYIEAERRRHAQALEQALVDLASRIGREASDWLKPVRHLPKGSPRVELPALAARIEADILVMGTVARTGIAGLLMGNTAETILHRLDCSVLAVKPDGFVSPVTLERP
ncbi:MAG: universal stress protein [Gammaproteobacteria bacterium]|nr:universal stress protein [Gammaproteobacteria bacterium]